MDSKPPLGCALLLRRALVDRYWGSVSAGGPSWHKGIWCYSSVVPDRGENQYITLQKHGISSRPQRRNHRVISTLTRSTWPNSPTATEQIMWKSLKVEDERTAQSLSDLPRRKKKTKWDHILFSSSENKNNSCKSLHLDGSHSTLDSWLWCTSWLQSNTNPSMMSLKVLKHKHGIIHNLNNNFEYNKKFEQEYRLTVCLLLSM